MQGQGSAVETSSSPSGARGSENLGLSDWKFWRRNPTSAPPTPQQIAAQNIRNEEQRGLFEVAMVKAKLLDSDAFAKGIESARPDITGYTNYMGVQQVIGLALNTSATPEQVGAAAGRIEVLTANAVTESINNYKKMMQAVGAEVLPHSQNYFISRTELFSPGQCAGLSFVMAAAVQENKQQTLINNLFMAPTDPYNPESQLMIQEIANLHARVTREAVYHNPAGGATVVEQRSYSTIAPRLQAAEKTTILMLATRGHAVQAGVVVSAEGQRTYHYYDPNLGYVKFNSAAAMEKGIKAIFTSPELATYTYHGKNPADPELKISEFSGKLPPALHADQRRLEAMYSVPLRGLDNTRLISTAGLPVEANFNAGGQLPVGIQLDDYRTVLNRLKSVHNSLGTQQYENALSTQLSIKHYLSAYPNSAHDTAMQALNTQLSTAIDGATPPSGGYAHVFEWMEKNRLHLVTQKMGPLTRPQPGTMAGVKVSIKESVTHPDAGRKSQVADALNAALALMNKAQPELAKRFNEVEVILSPENTTAHSQVYLGSPPRIVIGEDFFDVSAAAQGQRGVADRVAQQSAEKGKGLIQSKREAHMVSQLANIINYESNVNAYLNVVHNPSPVDGSTSGQVSDLAGRSSRAFMAESLTALIYDGRLAPAVTTKLSELALTHLAATGQPATGAGESNNNNNITSGEAIALTASPEVLRLKALDERLPPLRIGGSDATRVELYQMGLRLNGKAIEAALPNDPDGKKLINAVQLDIVEYSNYVRSVAGDAKERLIKTYIELGIHRDPTLPSLTYVPAQASPDAMKLNALLEPRLKKLATDFRALPGRLASSASTEKTGAALQIYGTYQSIRSIIDNINSGETVDVVIDSAALTTEYGGMGLEAGLAKLSTKLAEKTGQSAAAFAASSMGKTLKAGGAGAGLLTVPFEIKSAVDAFKLAAASTDPKVKQDNYVAGGIAVASAASSIAVTAALYSGIAAAGPAGIAIAVALILGQAIYSAVRAVEDIDDVVKLTGNQKLSAGWNSFWGVPLDYEIMKPYLEKIHTDQYLESNREQLTALLNGDLKDLYQEAFFGNVNVEVSRPAKESTSFFEDAVTAFSPVPTNELTSFTPAKPSAVTALNDSDDQFFIKNEAVSLLPVSSNGNGFNRVVGTPGAGKGLIWNLGGGNDVVTGAKSRSNLFLLGGGKKTITGGDKDDIMMMSPNDMVTKYLAHYHKVNRMELLGSKLPVSQRVNTDLNGVSYMPVIDAGKGNNTLIISPPNAKTTSLFDDKKTNYIGYTVALENNMLSFNVHGQGANRFQAEGVLKSFTNVATTKGMNGHIKGSDKNNKITVNGKNDQVQTGKGDNSIIINGGGEIHGAYTAADEVSGVWGGGVNTYTINKGSDDVTIFDKNNSVVNLDYAEADIVRVQLYSKGSLVVELRGSAGEKNRVITFKEAYKNAPVLSASEHDRRTYKLLPKFITSDGRALEFSGTRMTEAPYSFFATLARSHINFLGAPTNGQT